MVRLVLEHENAYPSHWTNGSRRLRPKQPSFLSGSPAAPYDHIILTELAQGHDQVGSPGSIDIVLTFRNLHNWMQQGDAPEMLAAIHRVLKPGGIFGVEDHRSLLPGPQDPKAKDGYVQQDYAIWLIEAAGFRLVGTSEINANPRDTTNWPKGVWTFRRPWLWEIRTGRVTWPSAKLIILF